ncbi:MAG: response regulator transcription factor [Bacillota bacterium]
MKQQILIVEDEKKIIDIIKSYLEKEGYEVLIAEDGIEAVNSFKNNNLDLVILDLMLPEISGEQVCKIIRNESNLPIIMVTAKSSEEEKIEGLNLGADDYLTKPFSPRELVARVKANLRRVKSDKVESESNLLNFIDGQDKLVVDTKGYNVYFNGENIDLTATEFKLSKLLAENPGQVYSRDQLTRLIQGYDYVGYNRTIDAHIKNLRQKLGIDNNQFIKTVYGVGYKFEV